MEIVEDLLSFEEGEGEHLEFHVEELLDLTGLADEEERIAADDSERKPNLSVAKESVDVLSVICFPEEATVAALEWVSRFCDDCSTDAAAAGESAFAPVKAKRRKRHGNGKLWFLSASPRLESPPSSPPRPSSAPVSCEHKEHKPKSFFTAASATGERRCMHCGAQRTPQWREGPQGSKTLCNACGVRCKSGRLLPEYRPACSPTFVRSKHSNCHRKVLEMRRKKLDEKLLSISGPTVFAC